MATGVKKLLRFCVVGGVVAVFDFGLIWIFVHAIPRLAAVAVAYLLAVALHFCLNRWWVFAAADVPAASQLPPYFLTVLACWLCTVGVAALTLATFTDNVFVAKSLAIPCATLLGFVLMRRFVFRHPPASGAG
jgi:putative flippase GtrA